MSSSRTHDREIYLHEERHDEPKEAFKLIAARIEASSLLDAGGVVADVGCANGELLYYLRRRFPSARLRGYDVVPELVERARTFVPDAEIVEGSVLDSRLVADGSLDVVVMSGVLSIFDEYEVPLANLLRWTKPGGRVLVFGLFNPHPVDVWVRYRLADAADPVHREPGWNIFSRTSVGRYLDSSEQVASHAFVPFELPFDLAPHADDPIRTWTFSDAEGRRLFTNGLSLLCNLDLLEIAVR